jgi:hypothetical protein
MSGRDAANRQRPLSHFCDAPAAHSVGRRQGGSARLRLRSRRHLRQERSGETRTALSRVDSS